MHTGSKSLVASTAILAVTLVGGLVGYRFGSAFDHGAMAAAPVAPAPLAIHSATSPDSYADIVDRAAPAVVTIRSARRVRAAQQFNFSDDPMFRQFFGNRFRNQQPDKPTLEHALGSGVIVNGDGYILTNHHVVDGAEQISVELSDRRSFEAKLIGSDAPSDLALLKIEAHGLPVLPLGDSNKVRVGDICLALGNPLGIGETVTSGIISAKGRATGLSDGSFEDFLQTDAAINQGNSGGALINTRGELVGINSQIMSPSGGNIGIGFAIPSNMAKTVMDELKNGGKVHRGKLGVGIQEMTSNLSKSLGLSQVRGVLVNSVDPNGPAQRAGIKTGDVITKVNGTQVDNANALRNQIAGTAPGSETAITVLRDGKEQQVTARLAELSASKDSSTPASESTEHHSRLGINVAPLTAEQGAQLGLRRNAEGLVVTDLDSSGPAASAGLKVDDVILEVNHQPVKSASQLQAAIQKSGSRPALLLINREGRSFFLAVQPS